MNILIIEDEPRAAQRLQKLVQALDPSVQVLEQLDSIESTVNWIQKHPSPDLIFMDIHLADGAAFEIFNQVKIDRPIIFTTAYDQYAIQAFQVNTIDYLLKPIKKEALKNALLKFQSLRSPAPVDYTALLQQLQSHTPPPKRFLVRTGRSLKAIDLQESTYFFTENKITYLVANDSKKYAIDYSLEKLEDELDPQYFFRVNRQCIVRAEAISKMVVVSKSRVKIYLAPGNYETIVSTERSGNFKRWLTGD
jgi:two-component system LytT family response regulator